MPSISRRIVAERAGNRDPYMAPHGVYPALPIGGQHDAWVAIAVRDDDDFRRLAEVVARPEIAGESRFATLEKRRRHGRELDAILADWTSTRPASECERSLQSAGIPAHEVLDSAGVAADGQLRFRGHFVKVAHPVHDETYVEASRFALSRTPARITGPAPLRDQHRDIVLNEILRDIP